MSSPSTDASRSPNKASPRKLTMDQIGLLFSSIDVQALGYITRPQFVEALESTGILLNRDARLAEVKKRLSEPLGHKVPIPQPVVAPSESKRPVLDRPTSSAVNAASILQDRIDLQHFAYIIEPQAEFIGRILRRQLVIPDWEHFVGILREIVEQVKGVKDGKVADYIPELALADANWFGVSFCSVDGQLFSVGDTDRQFSVQSSSKPISYLMALDELGEEEVHRYVGREPSGRSFNEIALNPEGIPHNPMVNSGAIMTCSLIKHGVEQSSRFRHIMDTWNAISGNNKHVTFSNSTYLSERATADRNFCLGYMMQEHDSFNLGSTRLRHQPGRAWGANDLVKNLELYFQCCSIETTAEGQAIIASTLAAGGRSAYTGQQCFSGSHVRHALSLMLSCGMYDYSGEWAYKIGLPAKSGVSGCLMVVIPNVGGLSIYSPPLDALGNTVRGIEFCKRLVDKCSFHYYDKVNGIVSSSSAKINPCQVKNSSSQNQLMALCTLCSKGDLMGIRALLSAGADANGADYDGRTPLHLAASEGQLSVVKWLCAIPGLNIHPADRWGGTPFSDALREGHEEVAQYLHGKLKHKGIPIVKAASSKDNESAAQTVRA